MIIGSHNSWTYLKPKRWWMKLISFTARCQDFNIINQYYNLGVKCFDLRVRFKNNNLIVAHGIIEYNISKEELLSNLEWMNKFDNIYVRIIHEARNKKQYTEESVKEFIKFCSELETKFKNIKFWCGKNLYNWTNDYTFNYNPSCEEKYASVCSPKIIDDWYPRWFAKKNNKKIIKEGTDKDILLIDFVNYGY